MSARKPGITVYVSGAHSTGKTTLLKSLLKHTKFSKFGFEYKEDVARILIERNQIGQSQLQDPKFLFSLEKRIAKLQHSTEHDIDDQSNGKFARLLCDRSIVDPIGYTKAFVGDSEAEELANIPYVKTMLERLKKGEDCLIFLIKPHRETMEIDGVRKDPEFEELKRLHKTMIEIVELQEIPYTEICCLDLEQRTNVVRDAVMKKWLFLL